MSALCTAPALQPMDAVATAIAAWGHTVVLGDSWGQLGVWDTLTGKTTTMPTGCASCSMPLSDY